MLPEHSLHIVVVAVCLWRGAYAGPQTVFWRAPLDNGEGGAKSAGGVFGSGPTVPKNGSCAETANKEGESVLVRAGVQPVRNGMAELEVQKNVGTRLTEAFMSQEAPQLTKRHREQLYPREKTNGNSGICDSIQ